MCRSARLSGQSCWAFSRVSRRHYTFRFAAPRPGSGSSGASRCRSPAIWRRLKAWPAGSALAGVFANMPGPIQPTRRRILVGLSGVFILAVSAGATYQVVATYKELASTPSPGQLVDVGGHRLHLWCTGAGAPAVMLETG